ncbi:PH domain-containing protein [Streptomyces sp. NPDC090741]|uniref:PH domain-containing protein n=1 Tax=Streptomyces sp. NPDC090741 TaxID=3365967 RepID=UPI00380A8A1A
MSEPAVIEGRLHPVTPWRRAWALTCAVVAFVFRDLPEWFRQAQHWPRWFLVLVAALVSLAGAAYGSWRVTSYRLTADALHYRTGILFQRRRRFELKHLQAADIHRPLLGRLFEVCTLHLSVSGQSNNLAYLNHDQAEQLRAALVERMSADALAPRAPGSEPAHEEGGQVLLAVQPKTLALSLVMDASTMLKAVLLLVSGLVPYAVSKEPFALLSVAGVLGPVWRMTGRLWPRWHGWTLTREPGGYRADFGLFDTRHQTFRHARTQAVVLEQPWLWRGRDWVRVLVATAGYRQPQILAPVATREEAERLVAELLGQRAVEVMNASEPAPRRACWATAFSRALSYRVDSGHVSVWRGMFLRNEIHLAPVDKIQKVVAAQGPWQRRLSLATVWIHFAGGEAAAACHRDAAEAIAITADLRRRAGSAPEAADPARRRRAGLT